MKHEQYAAFYGISVGSIMIFFWIYLLSGGSNRVPELDTRPTEMVIVIVAEAFTALMLIWGGILLLQFKNHASLIFYFALGTLTYSTLTNIGYTLEDKDYAQAGLMLIFIILNGLFFAKEYHHVAKNQS